MSAIFSLKERMMKLQKPSTDDFYQYMTDLKDHFKQLSEITDETYYEMNAKALVGEKEAVAYFQNEIEKFLRKKQFRGHLPAAYDNVIEALFHEWKGFGPAYRWFTDRQYGDSTGLQIIGKQIFYNHKGNFRLYPYSMPSLERVDQLKRALLKSDETKKVDREHPATEFKMNDPLWPGRFIRLAMWVHPRTWEDFPTISLRRQVIEYLSLFDQAGTNSIPYEAIELIRNLLKTKRNTIIAGPVNSGKSTFANTVVGEQLNCSRDCQGVVMIEKHPESILPYVVKGHRIIPVMAKNEDLMEVGIESLRHDPNYIYMTEMRYKEWEFYIWAGSKGYDGIIGTFHTKDSEDIPYQGATAVYTEQGGSLKGHLISALQASEIVFVMETTKDGKKRLHRLSEVFYDENQQTVYAHDFMRWNEDIGTWNYNADLSTKLLERMDLVDSNATDQFVKELRKLTELSPMKHPRVESIRSRAILSD